MFVAFFCVILSMYGGGFATVPAYLADMFGTQMVGAIHGRLLTAWATAGVLGPVLVNYIREFQINHGVEKAQAYDVTMYILAGLLVVGLICNLLVRPVNEKHFMSEEELAHERKLAHDKTAEMNSGKVESVVKTEAAAHPILIVLAWAAVSIPLGYSMWTVVQKAMILFK
jgi:MFS family permease